MRLKIHHHLPSMPEQGIDTIIELLLQTRGITDRTAFFQPPPPASLSLSTFGYASQADTVISRLKQAYDSQEQIVVYTDYDADGITGGSLLWETLHLLGFRVMPYVPHRQLEGYGFSTIGIDAIIKEHNPGLIISVDHGISAHQQIAYAKQQGVSVIVTDHHTRQETLPPADSIIHIPELSGSGVAYLVAQTIIDAFAPEDSNSAHSEYKSTIDQKTASQLRSHLQTDYLCLAAIGSVADLVPLTGATRSIVKHGLDAFAKSKRPGIQALRTNAQITPETPIDTYHIGFMLAPRINAIGRLEHALDAVRLLCTTSTKRAQALASHIGTINTDRQELVRDAVKQAEQMVTDQIQTQGATPHLIILHNPHWHEGIIGLIASHLTETYYRPTIILTGTDDVIKGSARSVSGINITAFLSQFASLLQSYGGHTLAGGLSMLPNQLEDFRAAALKQAAVFDPASLERQVTADIALPLELLTIELAEAIEQMAPFGMGNPRPVFAIDAIIQDRRLMGKQKNHLKLTILSENQNNPVEVVGFGKGELYDQVSPGQNVTIVGSISINEWRGKRRLQLKLIHWQER